MSTAKMKWNLNSSVSVQSLYIGLYLYSRKVCRERSCCHQRMMTTGKTRGKTSWWQLKFFLILSKHSRRDLQTQLPPTTAATVGTYSTAWLQRAGPLWLPDPAGGGGAAGGALTNGDPAVGAAEIDVAVRDGSHADLVERPREEGGKGAGKSHGPVTGGTTNCNAHLKEGHWTRTVNSSFISGFLDIVCRTSCPKNLSRSSCFYLLAFPERKGGNSPSQYLFSCISSAPCFNWQLLLLTFTGSFFSFLYLLKADIQRFLRVIPLFLLLDQRLTFSVQWIPSCYLQQTKIIISKREWIYMCYLDWYLLKRPFFSKMKIITRFLNSFFATITSHLFEKQILDPHSKGTHTEWSYWSLNKPKGAVTMFCSAM